MHGRLPEQCPHYHLISDPRGNQDAVHVRCRLLSELLQQFATTASHTAVDGDVVTSDTCRACCRTFVPTHCDLNPAVASVLWENCDRLQQTGETAWSNEQSMQLQKLKHFAESSFPIVLPDEDDLPAAAAPCRVDERLSLEELRLRIPQPTGLATEVDGFRISNWAVGVTTAPRRLPTLDQCLTSLIQCGWQNVHLFVDGEVVVAPRFASLSMTVRQPAAGAWRHYYLSLTELISRCPNADAVMLVQDDALWPASPAVREYLEQIAWPDDGRFIASAYCCADDTADSNGWHQYHDRWRYGAVGFIFGRTAVEEFVRDPVVTARCHSEYSAGIDDVIGHWAHSRGISVLFPTPSLVQHIGDVSTLWPRSRAVGLRRASRFVGNDSQAELIPQETSRPTHESRPVLCGWISSDPPIVYHSMGSADPGEYMPDEPMTRLAMYLWHQSTEEIVDIDRRARQLRPHHVLHHLVNDLLTCRQLVARGLSVHWINQNAFLDEREFRIQHDTPRKYDAVYNARMAAFKRHHLASEIHSLLILGGKDTQEDSDEYFSVIRRLLPHADFLYDTHKRPVSAAKVADLLNTCRVGLCLSECEGAMYAATEYLLCGLPIVSTVSLGGRDAWFDSQFTRIVPDDPAAVAAAVRELVALQIPPERIRTETLSRMWEHRRRFFDLGQTIYAAMDVGRDFVRDFYEGYSSKVGSWCLPQNIMRRRGAQPATQFRR